MVVISLLLAFLIIMFVRKLNELLSKRTNQSNPSTEQPVESAKQKYEDFKSLIMTKEKNKALSVDEEADMRSYKSRVSNRSKNTGKSAGSLKSTKFRSQRSGVKSELSSRIKSTSLVVSS